MEEKLAVDLVLSKCLITITRKTGRKLHQQRVHCRNEYVQTPLAIRVLTAPLADLAVPLLPDRRKDSRLRAFALAYLP